MGRPRKDLTEEQQDWLNEFLERSDISRVTPGRRDVVYIGIQNGQRQYAPKRYLLWGIRELQRIANDTGHKGELRNSFQER